MYEILIVYKSLLLLEAIWSCVFVFIAFVFPIMWAALLVQCIRKRRRFTLYGAINDLWDANGVTEWSQPRGIEVHASNSHWIYMYIHLLYSIYCIYIYRTSEHGMKSIFFVNCVSTFCVFYFLTRFYPFSPHSPLHLTARVLSPANDISVSKNCCILCFLWFNVSIVLFLFSSLPWYFFCVNDLTVYVVKKNMRHFCETQHCYKILCFKRR